MYLYPFLTLYDGPRKVKHLEKDAVMYARSGRAGEVVRSMGRDVAIPAFRGKKGALLHLDLGGIDAVCGKQLVGLEHDVGIMVLGELDDDDRQSGCSLTVSFDIFPSYSDYCYAMLARCVWVPDAVVDAALPRSKRKHPKRVGLLFVYIQSMKRMSIDEYKVQRAVA